MTHETKRKLTFCPASTTLGQLVAFLEARKASEILRIMAEPAHQGGAVVEWRG